MPKKVRLGTLELTLEEERQLILDNKIPSQPVEQGKEISDSIDRQPDVVEESVRITPERPTETPERSIQNQLSDLFDLRDREEVFRYVAPERVIREAALQSIESTRASAESYIVDLTIREIQRKGRPRTGGEGPQKDAGRRSNQTTPDLEIQDKSDQVLDENGRRQIFQYLQGGG
jgi:hypothetical protein